MKSHDWYLMLDTGEWECQQCRRIVADFTGVSFTEPCEKP